jgi:uncharacterized membrane protein
MIAHSRPEKRGSAMIELLAGIALFFGTHFISIVAPAWRNGMAAKLGDKPWKGLYSLVAIVGFVLMLRGYGQTRLDPDLLYTTPGWMRHVAALLMLPVFPLLLAAYFPGRIKATLKHPMLAATKFWALAHLLVNGMLGDVLLFGSFLVWAVADRISFKHREQGRIAGAPPSKWNDAIAVVVGLALYFAFALWWHVKLFGVVPVP